MANALPEQTQLIRSRLRAHGTTENMQIGLALSNLTDMMMNMAPRLRQLAQNLQAETTLEVSSLYTITHARYLISLYTSLHLSYDVW